MKKIFCILILSAAIFGATGKIIWKDLNLRESPTTSSRVVKTFHRGKYFKILGYQGDWVHANANGYIGYFKRLGTEYITIKGKYTIRDPDGVTFKWGPGQRYPDLAYSPANIVVEVVWEDGNYYFGQYNGSGVFFHKEALEGPKTDAEIQRIIDQRQVVRQPIPLPQQEIKPVREQRTNARRNKVTPQLAIFYANGGIDAKPDEEYETAEGYQQTIWALGGYTGLRVSMGLSRNIGLVMRIKGSWNPKDYVTPIRGTDYESTEQYIFASGNLGMEFDMGDFLTFGFGGGYGAVYDIISYGLVDGKSYSLSDEIYWGPTAYTELSGGLRHFRVFAGADYNYWVSDKSRFYVLPPIGGADVGQAVPDGVEYRRQMIRGFAGLQVLF